MVVSGAQELGNGEQVVVVMLMVCGVRDARLRFAFRACY